MIVFCPGCQSPAAVPTRAAVSSLSLACPRCSHRFHLPQVGGSLPEFELVAAADDVPLNEPQHRFASIAVESADAVRAAAVDLVAVRQRSSPAFDLRGSAASRGRPARRQSSTFWLLFQVVLGGAAALPLAVAILWYSAAYDPLGWAPAVSRYAPWIVPGDLQQRSGVFASVGGDEAAGGLPSVATDGNSLSGFTTPPSRDAPRTTSEQTAMRKSGVGRPNVNREIVEPVFAAQSDGGLSRTEVDLSDTAAIGRDGGEDVELRRRGPAVGGAPQSNRDGELLAVAKSLTSSPGAASAAALYAAFDSRLAAGGEAGDDGLRVALEELKRVSALKPLLTLSDRRLRDLSAGRSIVYVDVAKVRGVKPPDSWPEDSASADGEAPAGMDATAIELDASVRGGSAGGRMKVWVSVEGQFVRSLRSGKERPALLAGWLERRDDGELVWRVVEAVELR